MLIPRSFEPIVTLCIAGLVGGAILMIFIIFAAAFKCGVFLGGAFAVGGIFRISSCDRPGAAALLVRLKLSAAVYT